jgi:hypothetical protein
MLRRTEAAARDGTTGSVSSFPRKVAPDHIELTGVAEVEGAWSSSKNTDKRSRLREDDI